MAKRAEQVFVGVDVAKAELAILRSDMGQVETLANERPGIRRWLKALPPRSAIGIEATSTYHYTFIEEAHRLGHTVYVLDAYRLSRYRDSIGGRAKTDASDAALLLRYLRREQDELRPWQPPTGPYLQVHRLLQRRARLVEARLKISQTLKDIPELRQSTASLVQRIKHVIRLIEARLRRALVQADWLGAVKRCQGIEGIGELTATGLVKAFHRGDFSSADAFIAFLGLDVRVRDSGTMRGRRKLTKKGDPELRRLLFNAAMAASRSDTWSGFYQACLARGLKSTQALVALARKLARVAFALLRDGSTYQPKVA